MYKTIFPVVFFLSVFAFISCNHTTHLVPGTDEYYSFKADSLVKLMTIDEKIGQMCQLNSDIGPISDALANRIRTTGLGSVLNEVDPLIINQLQKIAVEENRLGIPLIIGRDVIHGFNTIFPTPIGLAATWNTELVEKGSRIAALEATSKGVNWTFAPMADVSRDPRWGRIAESFGEDPYLVSVMSVASQKGFMGTERPFASCAKHFAGYGFVEGGRDYNKVSMSEIDLQNTVLPPFKALTEAGALTFMTSFNDLNGVPSSGNAHLLKTILRDKWGFKGFVVSDWASVPEMIAHGFATDEKDAACKAINAGVDMEMATNTYFNNIKTLLLEGKLNEPAINDAVKSILFIKYKLGLFEHPFVDLDKVMHDIPEENLKLAQETAEQSIVLLKNKNNVLPLSKSINKLAITGPMANDRYEQLGTWIFDGDTNLTITPLKALTTMLGNEKIVFSQGLRFSRDKNEKTIMQAKLAVSKADAIVVFAGEENILTGEAHCRAYLDLPGDQNKLIKAVKSTGKPVILVVMTSRPLTIGEIGEYADAILYAWHPGTMGGPALANVIFGDVVPSGKLPVTFPKAPGQIPIYYNHTNTGRPSGPGVYTPMNQVPVRAGQTSLGNNSHYMDIGYEPLYPFGFGLSYTTFSYSHLMLSSNSIIKGENISASTVVENTGKYESDEIVQLYLRDVTASVCRPVKELKGFRRIKLKPGESTKVSFELSADQMGFYTNDGTYVTEPGEFMVWIGGSSAIEKSEKFVLNK